MWSSEKIALPLTRMGKVMGRTFWRFEKGGTFNFWYKVEISNRHSSGHVKMAIICKMFWVQMQGPG